MKDLEILEILKVLQSNKKLIFESVSGKGDNTEVVLDKVCFHTDYSICGNIWNSLTFNHDLKTEYYRSWEYYSGECCYPVSGKAAYESLENFWVGEQGKLRFSLIDHLVKCYSEQLGEKV